MGIIHTVRVYAHSHCTMYSMCEEGTRSIICFCVLSKRIWASHVTQWFLLRKAERLITVTLWKLKKAFIVFFLRGAGWFLEYGSNIFIWLWFHGFCHIDSSKWWKQLDKCRIFKTSTNIGWLKMLYFSILADFFSSSHMKQKQISIVFVMCSYLFTLCPTEARWVSCCHQEGCRVSLLEQH